jgi:hypothetical protein
MTVARLIAKIATSSSRRLRYTAGKDAYFASLARGILPRTLFEDLVQRKVDGILTP